MTLGWLILLALIAVVVAAVFAATTINVEIKDHEPKAPRLVIRFVIVWPSGPQTYEWRL